jgi:hypothetical protein
MNRFFMFVCTTKQFLHHWTGLNTVGGRQGDTGVTNCVEFGD